MNQTTNTEVKAVLRDVAHMLLGLFELHQADPLLVDSAAQELDSIVREHLHDQGLEPGVAGKLTLERLLDELEPGDPDEEQQGDRVSF